MLGNVSYIRIARTSSCATGDHSVRSSPRGHLCHDRAYASAEMKLHTSLSENVWTRRFQEVEVYEYTCHIAALPLGRAVVVSRTTHAQWGAAAFVGGKLTFECMCLLYRHGLNICKDVIFCHINVHMVICKIWGFYGYVYEECRLLRCGAAWLL
jgi:hypothetical protein